MTVQRGVTVCGVDREQLREERSGCAFAVLLVLLGVLVLAGWGCFASTDDPTPNPRAGSTTTIPCQDAAADIGESARLGQLEAEWFTESLLAGDVTGAQAHYDNTKFLSELALIQVDAFLTRCGSWARSEGVYTDLQQATANLESGLDRVRRVCRQELAPSGFDC